jgi:hypothetical protein
MHVDALVELVLKRVEDIVRMSFFYAICNMYILHSKYFFAWLNCSPLFFATKNAFFFSFPYLFIYFYNF